VVKWFKKEGSKIKRGEPVVELETDKVNYELDSPAGGVLLKIVAAPDSEVPVGDPLCCIGERGEAIPALTSEEK
jgi:pyruvate dehydrogenase E2 component (dihydrolipoyllysine-residue acetyltransferase)